MRRIDRPEHRLVDHPHFTGRTSAVGMGRLESPSGACDAAEVVSVACDGGSMTDWHSHARGQVLYVIGGRLTAIGQVGGEMTLEPGEGVYAAPGEVHRHGSATDDDDVLFLAVTMGGTQWAADTSASAGSRAQDSSDDRG
jgi:quercetin dioxygenase-like cupin family protein